MMIRDYENREEYNEIMQDRLTVRCPSTYINSQDNDH